MSDLLKFCLHVEIAFIFHFASYCFIFLVMFRYVLLSFNKIY